MPSYGRRRSMRKRGHHRAIVQAMVVLSFSWLAFSLQRSYPIVITDNLPLDSYIGDIRNLGTSQCGGIVIPPEAKTLSGAVNSFSSSTGPGLIHRILTSNDSTTSLSSSSIDNKMISSRIDNLKIHCELVDKQQCRQYLGFQSNPTEIRFSPRDIDIVVPTSSGDLRFLNVWREFFQGFHMILLYYGNEQLEPQIPGWVDYEYFNNLDIEKTLGKHSWVISTDCSAIRSFGWLVSKKQYIFTMDEGCVPITHPDGHQVNPLHVHMRNLMTPSTPYVFHPIYDPYSEGNDFARGYPYSLRGGTRTVVSHGLLGTHDNKNVRNVVQTVPSNTLFSLSSRNFAFDRKLMGPVMYQFSSSLAPHGSLLAGWISKVVADHLGLGMKSGIPYVVYSNSTVLSSEEDREGVAWQEEFVRWLTNDLLLGSRITDVQEAYMLIARQIDAEIPGLQGIDASDISMAMSTWINVWNLFQGGSTVAFTTKKSSPEKSHSPFNLEEKSLYPVDQTVDYLHPPSSGLFDILSYWGPKKGETVVTPTDVRIGHSWKTYIYGLPRAFHADLFEKFSTGGCGLLSPCTAQEMENLVPQYADLHAEILLLKKFVSSLHIVTNHEEADMFLVPALGVTGCHEKKGDANSGCRNGCGCRTKWFEDIKNGLFKMNSGKPHIFLATQDSTENHWIYLELGKQPNGYVIDLGPSDGLVVPHLNPYIGLQPSHFLGGIPFQEKDIFLLGFCTFSGVHCERVRKELRGYGGTKKVVLDDSSFVGDLYSKSVFILCLSGSKAHQKAVYDAWSAVAIPVVVVQECDGGKTHFHKCSTPGEAYYPPPFYPALLDKTYPKNLDGMSYSDLLVEVTPEMVQNGNVMLFLESISETVIMKKLQNIQYIRHNLIYDYNGTSEDAFTHLLRRIKENVIKFS